jgi:hypothetical protein
MNDHLDPRRGPRMIRSTVWCAGLEFVVVVIIIILLILRG